jgi:hypothetical protein
VEEPTSVDRNETPKERLDRNLNELLGELRVALPGVQVLFAFLLAVPFNKRFGMVDGFERGVYFAALVLTAIASALLIAPSAYHRIGFRTDDKRHLVFMANRFAIAGFAFLACAMTGSVMLVTSFIFGKIAGVCVAAVAAALFGTFWYVLPVRRRRHVARLSGIDPSPLSRPPSDPETSPLTVPSAGRETGSRL